MDRRSFFKTMLGGVLAITGLKLTDNIEANPVESIISEKIDTTDYLISKQITEQGINVMLQGNKVWFDCFGLTKEQRENSYVKLFLDDKEVLAIPCILLQYNCYYTLPYSIKMPTKVYAQLVTENE